MDPSRYYHLSSFCQADVAFDDAPVCLGVSLTDKLVFAFLSGIRVFQSFLTAEPSEAVRRIPAAFGAGSTFLLFDWSLRPGKRSGY